MWSYKRFFVLVISALMVVTVGWQIAAGQEATPEVTEAAGSELPSEGQLYMPMTFPITIAPELYDNPFDPIDIELFGIFTAPSGKELIVPGFWMAPYNDQCATCEEADWQPQGDPTWQVRFTPRETGEWTYRLQVRNNGATVATEDGQFKVAVSDRPGFIHAGANKRYFQYDNGEAYFPVGQNLKWSWDGVGGVRTYQRWLRELSESGGNYARLFIDVPWFINLEWNGPAGDYAAAQDMAAQLDAILNTAAEYGIALQLVLLWHQSLRIYNGPPVNIPEDPPRPDMSADWDNHPYNIVNGGPLNGPAVFFYDETALNLFKRRLRYLAARWGYSPQVFAWEIIDEIDRTVGYEPSVADSWLRSMVSYMRQTDQHGHLITAGSENFDPLIAGNPLLDFTIGEFYQRRPIETASDQVAGVVDVIRRNRELNPVPAMLTDFSLNPWFEPTGDDPQGIHVQMSMWAAALSGAAGAAVSDWWDTYIEPQGLVRYNAPLAAFAAGIDWANLNLQPAEAGLLTDDMASFTPVRINGFNRQFSTRATNVVMRIITPDGVFPDISTLPSYLYGQVFNSQFSQVQRYQVAPPVDTYLEVGVRSVSSQAGARLVISIDNQIAAELGLEVNNRSVVVRVPLIAGEHTITLDNIGQDWLELDYIEVGQLVSPARVLTLRDSGAGVALAWIQHRDYTWENLAAGLEREPILFEYRLNAMPRGRYVAEIWDPLAGAVLGEELLRVGDDGVLAFDLLPLNSQMAIRAIRQPDSTVPDDVSVDDITAPPTSTVTPAPTLAPTETTEATATPRPPIAQTSTPRPTEGPLS